MSRDRANSRDTREGVNFELSDGNERVIRAAMRGWAATLRLCLIVSVVAATSTVAVWTEETESVVHTAIHSGDTNSAVVSYRQYSRRYLDDCRTVDRSIGSAFLWLADTPR